MNAVTLPKELETWAEAEVAAGRAESVEILVAQAVSLRRTEVEWVRAKLNQARASVARGDIVDGDAFLAELDRWVGEDEAAS